MGAPSAVCRIETGTPTRRSVLVAHHQSDQAETVLMRLPMGLVLLGLPECAAGHA